MKIEGDWLEVLKPVFATEAYKDLYTELKKNYNRGFIKTNPQSIFNVFNKVSYKDTKVVMICNYINSEDFDWNGLFGR